MLVKANRVRYWLKKIFWKLFAIVENNGNCNFSTNGEKVFISKLFKSFYENDKGKKRVIFDIGANVGNYTQMIIDAAQHTHTHTHTEC